MSRAAAVLLACLAGVACRPAPVTTLPACPGANGRAAGWADYFPARTFDARGDLHNDFALHWFGEELASRDEPVLSCPRPGAAEAYRLLLLPSFASTWTVRVERTLDGAELHAVRSVGFRPHLPSTPPPKERRHRHLSAADWDRLLAAIAAADLWNLPSAEKQRGQDGKTWVVEALRPGAYHAVERWEPRAGTPFRAVGATFLDLAGLGALAAVPRQTFVRPTAPEDLK